MRYALWVMRYAWCVERWLQQAGPPDSSGFFRVPTFAPNVKYYTTDEASVITISKKPFKNGGPAPSPSSGQACKFSVPQPNTCHSGAGRKKNQEELRFFLTPFFMINKVRLSRVLPPEEVVEYLLVGKKTSFYPCVVNLNVRRRLTVKGELPCNLFLKQEILLLNLLSAAMRPKSVYIFQISNSTDTKRKIHISCISHFA